MKSQEFFMEKSWAEKIGNELKKPYMQQLQKFLSQELKKNKIIYPPHNLIFNAFCHTPFSSIKVVIVGQDPYHGPGQAHGLAFSVPDGEPIPPSLVNIYKELQKDIGFTIPKTGNLFSWVKQGVFLVNATLTVRASEPRSHYGKGWETFTDVVIQKLAEREDPLVFMLWGKSAQEKCEKVFTSKHHRHLILCAAHPSPLSAQNFLGCRHFSKANEFLRKNHKKAVDWQIK